IRSLLILTCTGVSFAHGSNDGQKGMGLIMLILIGMVPTAYALNRAAPPTETRAFVQSSQQTLDVLNRYAPDEAVEHARDQLTAYLQSHALTAHTIPALKHIVRDVSDRLAAYEEVRRLPLDQVNNVRNDLYVVSDTLRLMVNAGQPHFERRDADTLAVYKGHV